MVSFFRFIGTLLAFTHSLLTVAIPLEEWAQDVCGASVYGELVSILQKYDPAQAFCATVFPLQCTTSALKKRSASTTAKPSVITKLNTKIIDASSVEKAWATTKAPSNTEVSGDSKVSAWLRLLSQGQDVISTVCSCIQDHRLCPNGQSITHSTATPSTTTASTVIPSMTVPSIKVPFTSTFSTAVSEINTSDATTSESTNSLVTSFLTSTTPLITTPETTTPETTSESTLAETTTIDTTSEITTADTTTPEATTYDINTLETASLETTISETTTSETTASQTNISKTTAPEETASETTISETTTSTTSATTATSTTAAVTPSCSPGLRCSPGNYRYVYHCGEVISSGGNPNTPAPATNDDGCLALCDGDGACIAWSYTYETQLCTTYYGDFTTATTQEDPQSIWAEYMQGECPIPE